MTSAVPVGALRDADAFAAWLLDQPASGGPVDLPALAEVAMPADSCRPAEDGERALRLRRPLVAALARAAIVPAGASRDDVAATLREGVRVLEPTGGIVGLPGVSPGAAAGRIMRAPERLRGPGLLALRWAVELQSAACTDPAVTGAFREAHAAEAAAFAAADPAMRRRDLLYGDHGGAYLLLAPRAQVAEIRAVREQLAGCASWSDAERVLAPEWFARLVEECGPASGDDALDLPTSLTGGSWPFLRPGDVPGLVPDAVLEELGEPFGGLGGSGWNLPLEHADAIIAALSACGVACAEDPDLEAVFADDP